MARKYQLTFDIVETEEEAQTFCSEKNREATRYIRTHHPAHYTATEFSNGTKYVCLYMR